MSWEVIEGGLPGDELGVKMHVDVRPHLVGRWQRVSLVVTAVQPCHQLRELVDRSRATLSLVDDNERLHVRLEVDAEVSHFQPAEPLRDVRDFPHELRHSQGRSCHSLFPFILSTQGACAT